MMIGTLGEKLDQKRAAAREKIRSLLWADADPDEIIDAAISGGLQRTEIEAIETETREGKAAIARLSQFDLSALKNDHDAKKQAAEKAERKLGAAQDAYEIAANEARAATTALDAAREAFNGIAGRVSAGELPAKGLPAEIGAIIEASKSFSVMEDAERKLKQLLSEITKTEVRASAMEAEAEKLRDTKSNEHNLRMQPLATEYAASAATMRKQVEAGKKRVKILERDIAEARKRYEAARAALPW